MKNKRIIIIPKKDRKIVTEKKFGKKTVQIERPKKEVPTLEKEIAINEESVDVNKLRAKLRSQKAPVLERITSQQTKKLEPENPLTPQAGKKEDEVKYGSKIDYGTNRETDNKDGREIRYQTATEYVTGREEKRKFQEGEAFDPSLMHRGNKKNADELRKEFRSEYEIKKKKYE